MDGFGHLAAWPVDNSAPGGAAARRGERKSEKGSDGALSPYLTKDDNSITDKKLF